MSRSKVGVFGSCINVVNGFRVHHAKIIIKKRTGAHGVGDKVTETSANGRGHWATQLEPGKYWVYFKKEGFMAAPVRIKLKEHQRRTGVASAMSPKLSGHAVRFVLMWGNHPRDLDSHLKLPTGCKVAWNNRKCSGSRNGLARLDHDATRGHGPETVTIPKPVKGLYSYHVNQYSHDGNFATSEAKVFVYQYNGKIGVFKAKKASEGKKSNGIIAGRIWKVFKWKVNAAKEGKLVKYK